MEDLHIKNTLAKLGLLSVAIIWGTGFTAAQFALDAGITPFYMMVFRFSIASLLLYLVCFKTISKNFRQYIKPGFILGVFLFLAFAFQTFGLQFTTPSKNAFLTGLNVIIAPFIFWIILKTKPKIYTFVGAFIAMMGIALISLDFSQNLVRINKGDLLTIICALFFACHIVYVGYYSYSHKLEVIKLVFIQLITAALLSFFSALFFEEFNFVYNTKSVGSLLYLGVFSTLIAFGIQNVSQQKVPSTTAAIILSTESVFGAIASVLFVKEVLQSKVIIGGALIILAIIITETRLQFLRKPKKS